MASCLFTLQIIICLIPHAMTRLRNQEIFPVRDSDVVRSSRRAASSNSPFHNCSRMTRAVRYFAFESRSPHLGARWRRPSLELDLFCFCLFLSFTKRCCLWQRRPWEGDRLLSIPDGLPAFIQAFFARGLHPLSVSSTYLLFGAHFLFLAIEHCSHWRPWLRNYLCRCPQRSAPELLTQNLFLWNSCGIVCNTPFVHDILGLFDQFPMIIQFCQVNFCDHLEEPSYLPMILK